MHISAVSWYTLIILVSAGTKCLEYPSGACSSSSFVVPTSASEPPPRTLSTTAGSSACCGTVTPADTCSRDTLDSEVSERMLWRTSEAWKPLLGWGKGRQARGRSRREREKASLKELRGDISLQS